MYVCCVLSKITILCFTTDEELDVLFYLVAWHIIISL